MKKLILEDAIREKNKKQEKNIGCVKKLGNAIFLIFLIINMAMIGLVIMCKRDVDGLLSVLLGCLLFLLVLKFFSTWAQKLFTKTFQKNIHNDNVKVFIEKLIVVDKYDELEYSYVPNSDRTKAKFYVTFSDDEKNYTLSVSIDIYRKLRIDDEVYVARINDKYYSDMIFKTNEYELDNTGIKALKNEIIIKI